MNIRLTIIEAEEFVRKALSCSDLDSIEIINPDSIGAKSTPSVSACLDDIRRAFASGNIIARIQAVRTVTGWGLKDSKDFVETIVNALDKTKY